MESKTVDAVEFRDGQQQQWNSAASGWRRWSELIDGAASGISERLVELAGVEPGSRVLDVAAGYGEPSLTAARATGPEGAVLATDISAEMIAFGRERATAAGLENIEFVQSDAASLDFPQASFDAALSRWGIIFEPDAEAAATRIRSGRRWRRSEISEPGPAGRRTSLAGTASRCNKCGDRARPDWSPQALVESVILVHDGVAFLG